MTTTAPAPSLFVGGCAEVLDKTRRQKTTALKHPAQ